MKSISLGAFTLDPDSKPYIIAEIGVNHEGDLDLAKRLIDQAKEGGANAAKFQSYKASRIASKNSPAYWDTKKEPTKSQFELFSKYDKFGPDQFCVLKRHCDDIGIDFVSTPFDAEAVEFLDPLMSFYKIASADLTNKPMLRQIAAKDKPVLLSTGASNLWEIDLAVETLRDAGCDRLVLLHCILNYPCDNKFSNLNMIDGLKRAYPEFQIGYSDHTIPDERMQILTAAWLKGAVVVEKHFTHDKTLQGNDHYHAMDLQDLKKFTENINFLHPVLGHRHKRPLVEENSARLHARRSIVVERNLVAGQVIKLEDLTCKRPAHGISPLYWDEIIGRTVLRDLEVDHVLKWEDLV